MLALQTSYESSDLGASVHCSDGRRVMCLGVGRINAVASSWTVSILLRSLDGEPGDGALFYDEETLIDTGPDPLGFGFARLGVMLAALADGPVDDVVSAFARAVLASEWPDLSAGRPNVVPLRGALREREGTTGR